MLTYQLIEYAHEMVRILEDFLVSNSELRDHVVKFDKHKSKVAEHMILHTRISSDVITSYPYAKDTSKLISGFKNDVENFLNTISPHQLIIGIESFPKTLLNSIH